MVLAAWFFDRADGLLARRQQTASAWGAWLDANVDELVDVGLHVAVAAAAATLTGSALPWALLVAFLAGKYLLVCGLALEEHQCRRPGAIVRRRRRLRVRRLAPPRVSSARQRRRAGSSVGVGAGDRLAHGRVGPGGRVLQPAMDRPLRARFPPFGRPTMSSDGGQGRPNFITGASPGPTITAAIIALDEEANLAELLPRLDWVDEIVVVDGGSRDATVAIAEAHGCRVLRRRVRHVRPAAQRRAGRGHRRLGAVDRRRRAADAAAGGRNPPPDRPAPARRVSRADPQHDLRTAAAPLGHAGRPAGAAGAARRGPLARRRPRGAPGRRPRRAVGRLADAPNAVDVGRVPAKDAPLHDAGGPCPGRRRAAAAPARPAGWPRPARSFAA